jgi:HK97 gp10 family phage protein
MGFSFSVSRKRNGDPIKAVDKAVENSNLAIGVAIASQAKLLTPVQFGQSRNSLSASSLKETKGLNDRPGENAPALDTQGLRGDEVYVGSNGDHFLFHEMGTKYQAAQPALRPAKEIIINGKTATEIIEKYGREAMEREIK